jgi:predicted transglutaminase-like cysteine proteinase
MSTEAVRKLKRRRGFKNNPSQEIEPVPATDLAPPTKKDIVREVVKEAVKEAVKKIQSIEDVKTIDEERQELWEGKFKKVPVLYNAQYGRPRDVRTFIFDVSHMLETMVSEYKLKGVNDEETMLNCCLFVQKYIRYIGDVETKGQTEFWQNPEDTLTAGRGDCEDGALLMKSLTLVAGMPDWKCKVVAGDVRGGGHAYCVYVRDDDTQCVMDWCYWPNQDPVNKRKCFEDEENYNEIWFSFQRKYSYAEKKVEYSAGRIKAKEAASKKAAVKRNGPDSVAAKNIKK